MEACVTVVEPAFQRPRQSAVSVIVFMLLVIPWVNPFSFGPTPAVAQWLLTGTAATTACLLFGVANVSLATRRHIIARAWIASAAVSAVIALLQYFGAADFFGALINRAEVGQAYANLRQRNQLATLLNIGLVAVVVLPLGTKKDLLGECGAAIVLVMLLSAANAATGSRTGFFQLWLLIAMGFFWRRDRKLLLPMAASYVAAAWILPASFGSNPFASGILSRVTESNLVCTSRLTLWSNVLHLVSQKPWLGWGWSEVDYAHFITLYPGVRFCEILDNAHNLPLHLAVELGIPVALVFCGACAWMVWRNKPWAETVPTRQLAWGVLAVIGLHSMLEYPLWYGPFQMAFALCIWLLWRPKVQALGAVTGVLAMQPHPVRIASGWMGATAAALVMGAVAYAAWDYHRISQIYLAPQERSQAYRDHPLEKAQASWLFRDQVQFAELTTTELTPDNAAQINALAKEVLHFSPESRVVAKVIESAIMLGHDDEVAFFSQRFQAAYPQEYAHWNKRVDSNEAK